VQAKSKSRVKLSLAEFISTVGGGEDNEDETPSRVLWVGNIGPEVSEEELTQEFTAYGKLESLRILHDRFCAFVNFEEEECAKRAKAGLNGTIIGSQYIVINYRKADSKPTPSTPPTEGFLLNPPSRALWIGNISEEVTEDRLYLEFSHYGEIESVRLLTHKTCAFVNFSLAEEASEALRNLQGRELGGMPIKINFGKPPKRHETTYGGYVQAPSFVPAPFYPEFQYYPPPYLPPWEQYPVYVPCDLCGTASREVVALPCGHSVSCGSCLGKLREGNRAGKCLYCGASVEKYVGLFGFYGQE